MVEERTAGQVSDIEGRICHICEVESAVCSGDLDVVLCGRCADTIEAGAAIARGYGEWMRSRYERGDLEYGPDQMSTD